MSWLRGLFKKSFSFSIFKRDKLVDQLAENLLALDYNTRNKAVDVALKLTSEGNECGVKALERAICQKHASTDCAFYEPLRGPRVHELQELQTASAELLNLAINSQLWVRPPHEIQKLMANSSIVANWSDLLREVEERAGADQAHAFQLLATHLQAKAKLINLR